MDVRVSKSNQPIGRVKCVVDSCHFWGSGKECLAQEIEIQPPGAQDTQTTDCATFTPKNMQ
ncbi:DUF1540 domain-containing protein [Irregularibacter muris]|uniref:DUF1540 domain-containing protein n=1 Tax=Irregularibacter muris TaxID=1796619 RepID=A0AAE3HG70_9FIRM|nr:DUF1540 domain-containing protein [Irregularibacter muris]MCR1900036.1 DUF1540 domain-containing protein [Irregularibacter muris]